MICCFTLLFSCNPQLSNVPMTTLTYDREANVFRDTIFFGTVKCLLEKNGSIYFTDKNNVRIMRTDKELNFLNIIGKSQGRGPKDLGYIEYFDVARDTLWVGDNWKQAFVKFTTYGEFLDVVEPGSGKFAASSRFMIDGQKVYLPKCDVKTGTSLAVLDMQTGEYRQFGKSKDFGNININALMNMYDVFVDKDRIIGIPQNNTSLVEIYDTHTLELVESYNLMHLPQIKALDTKMRNNPNFGSPNWSYMLITNPYLSGHKLYFTVNVYEGDSLHSEILVLDTRDEMKLVKQYRLDENTFTTTFCVTDDYLYASVPQINAIRRYPLK